MLRICKIGTKWPGDPYRGWRDGQLIELFPSNTPMSSHVRKHFLIIEDGIDYWTIRGDVNWKSTKPSVLDFKKLTSFSDTNDKYPWEFGYDKTKISRKRDYFVDPKFLLDTGLINNTVFERIYNKDDENNIITLLQNPSTWVFHEKDKQRRLSVYSATAGSVATGTFFIGSGLSYNTLALFESDIAATLTGNLTAEHADEESVVSTIIIFDTDTNNNLLKIIAKPGAEHNGGAYGNGARLNFNTGDEIQFNETNDGELDDVEICGLALDISGGNTGIFFEDGADTGLFTVNRMLIKGDANSLTGIKATDTVANVLITNNLAYGIGDGGDNSGIHHISFASNPSVTLYNNTCIGNFNNFNANVFDTPTLIYKNNMGQNPSNKDYADDGFGFGTSAKNISEDTTSPDAAYRLKDLHTNSIFRNFGSDDYRLDIDGDATNLAVADDGDNLFGVGIEVDVQGQARDNGTPFWIGSSHAASNPVIDATENPFTVTGLVSLSTQITNNRTKFQGFLWRGATVNGHRISITDQAGNQLWKEQMTPGRVGEDILIEFPLGLLSPDGIYIDDMDSGEFYAYI